MTDRLLNYQFRFLGLDVGMKRIKLLLLPHDAFLRRYFKIDAAKSMQFKLKLNLAKNLALRSST